MTPLDVTDPLVRLMFPAPPSPPACYQTHLEIMTPPGGGHWRVRGMLVTASVWRDVMYQTPDINTGGVLIDRADRTHEDSQALYKFQGRFTHYDGFRLQS